MHKIHISFDTKVWIKNYNNIEKIIRNILKKSIMSEKKFLSKNVEISVLLTSSKKMIILNHKFRKKKKDTDILSFPNEKPNFYRKKLKQKNIYLGDLALSFNYIKKQKIEFEEYLKKMLIHGFLHLIGYDHNNEKNYLKMEKVQNKILKLV
jgi:probable rRNA maturation factor